MPWKMSDAPRHTKQANTPAAKSAWQKTANAVLAKTGDDAKAIRIANSVVKKTSSSKRKSSPARKLSSRKVSK